MVCRQVGQCGCTVEGLEGLELSGCLGVSMFQGGRFVIHLRGPLEKVVAYTEELASFACIWQFSIFLQHSHLVGVPGGGQLESASSSQVVGSSFSG